MFVVASLSPFSRFLPFLWSELAFQHIFLKKFKVFPSRRGTELHTYPEELGFERFNLYVFVARRQ